jgi:hypothetical protein
MARSDYWNYYDSGYRSNWWDYGWRRRHHHHHHHRHHRWNWDWDDDYYYWR